MASTTYTVDQIRQIYSVLPSRVNERLKKSDKVYTDDRSIDHLKNILVTCGIVYELKTTDMGELNLHEITIC